jgi:hypothetical protein
VEEEGKYSKNEKREGRELKDTMQRKPIKK